MTHRSEIRSSSRLASSSWATGLGVAGLVAFCLIFALFRSPRLGSNFTPGATVTVQRIGAELMGPYVVALEAMGVLLTAALLGAIVIALRDPEPKTIRRAPDAPARPRASETLTRS